MRLLRLLSGLFVISLQRALTYRTDLIFQGLMTATGIAAGIAAIGIIFAHVQTLAGWTLPETIALLGAFTLVSGLLETFVEPNLAFFGSRLVSGQLDDTLLQPASPLFLVSFSTIQPWALSTVLLGGLVMALGLSHLGTPLLPLHLLAGSIWLLGGTVIVWSYRLSLASLAFWAPGLEPTVLFQGLWQMGRYPVSIYRQPLRWGLTYVIPVAFVTSTPVQVLVHGASLPLAGESLAAVCGSLAVVMLVWRVALRRYTGATA